MSTAIISVFSENCKWQIMENDRSKKFSEKKKKLEKKGKKVLDN